MRKILLALFLLISLGCGREVVAQNFYENRPDLIPANASSYRGLPLSSTTNTPAGSDGRAPTPSQQSAAGLPTTVPTEGQFLSAMPAGSAFLLTSTNLGNASSFLNIAKNIALPRGTSNGVVTMVLRQAQVGGPFLGQQISYLFGAIIPVPTTDELGVTLTKIAPENYWLPEPYSVNEHLNANYYWSPNKQAVFAVQPGRLSITWQRAVPVTGNYTNDTNYVAGSGGFYRLHTATYLVSGAPVKEPKKIYWTEGEFAKTGKRVAVPPSRINAVKVVYNSTFPPLVTTAYVSPGSVQQYSPTNSFQEKRTLWFDPSVGSLSAFNAQGRVFVELLGGEKEDHQSRIHLGFEIVDVYREVNPDDVTVELGKKLTAFAKGGSDLELFPEPVLDPGNLSFTYRHEPNQGEKVSLYAIRETTHENDYLVHWMKAGEAGILWPYVLTRYKMIWPANPDRYSHYLRPEVETEEQARETAVALPSENAPFIDYQDPLDQARGKLTEDFKFYTFLNSDYPTHRAVLRYISGVNVSFELIFSWLDRMVRKGDLADTLATNLTGWDPAHPNLQTIVGATNLVSARVESKTVMVGQRLTPPTDEKKFETGLDYLAGQIRPGSGTGYSITAYIDPFAAGFEEAAKGAIIPINAANNDGKLEVWWFRKNKANANLGFKPVYWPSVMSIYSVQWPLDSSEIVLASNDGSGGLGSLEAAGHLYVQNNPLLPGYNPNEEHALMLGGQIYALRDDLNLTEEDHYSSAPFVLLEYMDADGRPSMRLFHVLREKPGMIFNYPVTAGRILQGPMPLPLLETPMAPRVAGEPPQTLNLEVQALGVASATAPGNNGLMSLTTSRRPLLLNYSPLALQNDAVGTRWFFPTNINPSTKTLSGLISSNVPYTLHFAGASTQPANLSQYTFAINTGLHLKAGDTVMVAAPDLSSNWMATVSSTNRDANENDVVTVQFASTRPALSTNATLLMRAFAGDPASYAGWRLAPEKQLENVLETGLRGFLASFLRQDRKGNSWVFRGPHQETDQPYLAMQFYYKTLAGFNFPSLDASSQPPVGTITPYLRALESDGITYVGDPVYGNKTGGTQAGDGNPLPIFYHPTWPENVPVLNMAETLTLPKRGLPQIRGQSSLKVVYQQSQAQGTGDLTKKSVVLHDSTREKIFNLGPPAGLSILGAMPPGIKTQVYQGKTYFPELPPHLSDRFYFDPARGTNGALVFKGQFVDSPVGDDYTLLNVLGPQDSQYLRDLCPGGAEKKQRWDDAITNGLSAKVELFRESRASPGTVVVQSTTTVGPGSLVEITDDDMAVDSYALTAMGPGVGYATLITGNGQVFTPADEPVSLQIIKVVNSLYSGEVKVVQSSNPLSEKITLQQVVDLGGAMNDYEFEWRIASPVNGAPPPLHLNTRRLLLDNASWNHVSYPLPSDSPATLHKTPDKRLANDVAHAVITVSEIAFNSLSTNSDNNLVFTLPASPLNTLVAGNGVVMRDDNGVELLGYILKVPSATRLVVALEDIQTILPTQFQPTQLFERVQTNLPQSIVFTEFQVPSPAIYSQYWLSLDLDEALGAKVYVDGQRVVQVHLSEGNTPTSSASPALSPLPITYLLGGESFAGGIRSVKGIDTHRVVVELFSSALPNVAQTFNLRLEAFEAVDQVSVAGSPWLLLEGTKYRDGVRAILGESADVRSLSDNYLTMHYRATNAAHASYGNGWSQWTEAQLTEGWIKRVLAGINPFNQRVTDLFNNQVNTDASIISQAGKRWEGDVALNLSSINDSGLIEIYETVLHRGRNLSIDAGINYGPANDALLLAAGYLNDLYMMLGNEAWADAANPTIGIGTKDSTYGEIATSLFAFKGQTASLLEEELALLRGRDDFLQPGVQATPVYNRLFWNYTRGIDSGEVIYALNYNIQENNNTGVDGAINAEDARRMFPQGHGDAYGHYLTALKGYYSLVMDTDFDWVPRTEAVTILGKAVQIDYQDERKFAAAAAAVARVGKQTFDLTWRKDYRAGHDMGWEHLSTSRANSQTLTTRFWGVDHWASRTMQGAYLNWVTGNAIVPDLDGDPSHEGIQKIDRTTVPELKELAMIATDLQSSLENAEGGLTPLGLPENSIALDINPSQVTAANGSTHFEQVYKRATAALNNAVVSFDDAKNVTRLMRSEQDSLSDLQARVAAQELAYKHSLIELYGSPYPDDMGPGKLNPSGYDGPDLVHFMYVENVEKTFSGLLEPKEQQTFKIDLQKETPDFQAGGKTRFDFYLTESNPGYLKESYLEFTLDSHGFFQKPSQWRSQRHSPGKVQDAISKIILAKNALARALEENEAKRGSLDRQVSLFAAKVQSDDLIHKWDGEIAAIQTAGDAAAFAAKMIILFNNVVKVSIEDSVTAIEKALPTSIIVGTSFGGDTLSAARGAMLSAAAIAKTANGMGGFVVQSAVGSLKLAKDGYVRQRQAMVINPMIRAQLDKGQVIELENSLDDLHSSLFTINQRLQEFDDSTRNLQSLLAQADRIQQERQVFRQRSAALVQGFRTRDAAFRIFRNEKLERYRTLFDLSSRYAFLAANAYDYETGLLNTPKGRGFVSRIISSRALGVVKNGEPQYAGSDTGDPGLSSALAEMKADWEVLKGRLGFNNPDGYGTTVSLRMENFRILPGIDGSQNWKDVLNQGRMDNILQDEDVRRYCMQVQGSDNLPVPGIVITFETTIGDGLNLFGRARAAGDHWYSPSSFATKIFAAGIALEGYKGMDDPTANGTSVSSAGGTSPADPSASYLDPDALGATPYIYLIPVGVDSMRSPPLGDSGSIRSWNVADVTIPMPFNIGGSEFSNKQLWQSSDSLSEPLFGIRKHQAFRPVSTTAAFSNSIYGSDGQLLRSQFTNSRLIGRSVWNSKWKIVIPARELLNDPKEGLDRFIKTVTDVKLRFVTYSYSGN